MVKYHCEGFIDIIFRGASRKSINCPDVTLCCGSCEKVLECESACYGYYGLDAQFEHYRTCEGRWSEEELILELMLQ